MGGEIVPRLDGNERSGAVVATVDGRVADAESQPCKEACPVVAVPQSDERGADREVAILRRDARVPSSAKARQVEGAAQLARETKVAPLGEGVAKAASDADIGTEARTPVIRKEHAQLKVARMLDVSRLGNRASGNKGQKRGEDDPHGSVL